MNIYLCYEQRAQKKTNNQQLIIGEESKEGSERTGCILCCLPCVPELLVMALAMNYIIDLAVIDVFDQPTDLHSNGHTVVLHAGLCTASGAARKWRSFVCT